MKKSVNLSGNFLILLGLVVLTTAIVGVLAGDALTGAFFHQGGVPSRSKLGGLPLDSPCSSGSDCQSGICLYNLCVGSNLPVGSHCIQNSQCASQLCQNSQCATTTPRLPDYAPCQARQECQSGLCLYAGNMGNICSPVNLPQNAPCIQNSQCSQGLACINASLNSPNLCLPPRTNGQPCIHDADCSSRLCLNNLCVPRGAISVGQPCLRNEQCVKDSYCSWNSNSGRSLCRSLLSLNQTCGSGVECASGLCGGGSPRRCITSNSLPLLNPCSGDRDCASNLCVYTRISSTYSVSLCADRGTLQNGGSCGRHEQCVSGFCDLYISSCAPQVVQGSPCRFNEQCAGFNVGGAVCVYDRSTSTRTCQRAGLALGVACADNSQCRSGYCRNGNCF